MERGIIQTLRPITARKEIKRLAGHVFAVVEQDANRATCRLCGERHISRVARLAHINRAAFKRPRAKPRQRQGRRNKTRHRRIARRTERHGRLGAAREGEICEIKRRPVKRAEMKGCLLCRAD